MQPWVLPVGESPFAARSGAAEVRREIIFPVKSNVAPDEKMFADAAESRLGERPPLLERIGRLKRPELPAVAEQEGMQGGFPVYRHKRFYHNRAFAATGAPFRRRRGLVFVKKFPS